MPKEFILRLLCAFLIIVALFFLFLWRVAIEEANHYKSQSEFNAKAKLADQYYSLLSKLEKTIIKHLLE